MFGEGSGSQSKCTFPYSKKGTPSSKIYSTYPTFESRVPKNLLVNPSTASTCGVPLHTDPSCGPPPPPRSLTATHAQHVQVVVILSRLMRTVHCLISICESSFGEDTHTWCCKGSYMVVTKLFDFWVALAGIHDACSLFFFRH